MIIDTELDEKIFKDEEDLLKDYDKDFNYEIRKRGSEYYYSNNVISVFKCQNKYIAKVMGNGLKPYNVVLEVKDSGIDYNCSCPCTFNCKHEYATLMAISNKDYSEIELKEKIKEQDSNFKTILEKVPAEEIKKYLLSNIGMDNVVFEIQ